jgi:putative lipoic acid-binding regulatory protein
MDYTKLRKLLEDTEKFPHEFVHKFIGKNTPEFATGVSELERKFPGMKLSNSRMSRGDGHVALTYVYLASTPDDVVALFKATESVPDVLVVL